MKFDLNPPFGVEPLWIGMSMAEAREAMTLWGDPRPYEEGSAMPPGLGWTIERDYLLVMARSDRAEHKVIDFIEISTPGYGEPTDDEVLFLGINVFRLPVVDVVGRIRGLGIEVTQEDDSGVRDTGDNFDVPDRLLHFWRSGGPEDDDGRALYFESAAIGVNS